MLRKVFAVIVVASVVGFVLHVYGGKSANAQTSAMKPGTVIQDCPYPECPTMVFIPAGSFMMGSLPGEEFIPHEPADPKATPRHLVTFAKPYAIGEHEVTKEEFAAFAKATNFQAPKRCSLTGPTVQILHGHDWRAPTAEQWSDNEPVQCTNFYDALLYTDWLTKKTGHKYRLPSEAEWEYAARAGTQTFWFFGDDIGKGCRYFHGFEQGRFASNPEMAKQLCSYHPEYNNRQHVPVKAYDPNPWGLYGVEGNGWELAVDCWHQDYTGAPTDGSAWIDNPYCNLRVTRGDGGGPGTWSHHSHRYPVLADEHRSNTGTFRVLRELDPSEIR